MAGGLHIDLSSEPAVDEDNVSDGESHAEGPPYEADRKRVRAGEGFGQGDVAVLAGGGGEQGWIKPPAGSGEHEEQIEAR